MRTWEKFWMSILGICFIFLFTLIGMGMWNLTRPKEFKGYYLYSGDSNYTIYTNWENREDTRAFRTTDPNEALRVFHELNGDTLSIK